MSSFSRTLDLQNESRWKVYIPIEMSYMACYLTAMTFLLFTMYVTISIHCWYVHKLDFALLNSAESNVNMPKSQFMTYGNGNFLRISHHFDYIHCGNVHDLELEMHFIQISEDNSPNLHRSVYKINLSYSFVHILSSTHVSAYAFLVDPKSTV